MVSIANPPNSGKAQGVFGGITSMTVERKKRKEEIVEGGSEEERGGSTRPVGDQ